ncbi:MAG: hypothetical protein ACO3N7_03355 [Kiritimatiellia bacterium]
MSGFFFAQVTEGQLTQCRSRCARMLAHLNRPCHAVKSGFGGFLMAAAPHSGVLQTFKTEREMGVLLGYALDERGRRLSPEDLSLRWKKEPAFQPDGYFAAVVVRADGSLTVAVDPLGLYPCHYTQLQDGCWVLASAARDLGTHPDFRPRPDPEGIAGQLLLNAPLYLHSTLEDVRLIPPCSILHLRQGEPAEICAAGKVPLHPPGSFEEAYEEYAARLESAFRKHAAVAAGEATDLLLSGGRDSRTVAALVVREGIRPRPVTFGLRHEFEVRAARAVAADLGLRPFHWIRDQDPVWMLKAWEQRAIRSAGYGGGTFGGIPMYAGFAPWMHHGVLIDDLLGGFAMNFSWNPEIRQHEESLFFEKLNRWGFPAETLRDLYRDPEAGELGLRLRDRVLADFKGPAGETGQASFDWKFKTRVRTHLGATLWDLTRYTWPIVPGCDQELFAFMRGLPMEWVGPRRLQNRLLASHAPHMLEIPFDNNTMNFVPDRMQARRRFKVPKVFASSQPLRYHRIFDLHSPGWRAVVPLAEAGRESLHGLFRPERLEGLWPRDLRRYFASNPFAGLAGMRSLMVLAGYFAQDDL